jgi:hypothetical protein
MNFFELKKGQAFRFADKKLYHAESNEPITDLRSAGVDGFFGRYTIGKSRKRYYCSPLEKVVQE